MPNSSPSLSPASQKSLYAHDFRSLNVRDLLDARDQFHVHLAQKVNVLSTAIGLFLIRDKDKDSKRYTGWAPNDRRRRKAPERTLSNSSVKDWSETKQALEP